MNFDSNFKDWKYFSNMTLPGSLSNIDKVKILSDPKLATRYVAGLKNDVTELPLNQFKDLVISGKWFVIVVRHPSSKEKMAWLLEYTKENDIPVMEL